MNREINTDITSGLIGLLLTAVFFFALEDISWMSIIFPRTVVYIMAIISGILVVKGLVRPSQDRIFSAGSNTRWMVTGVLFFLWVLLMPVLGFFVSTVVFMTAIVGYLARARMQVGDTVNIRLDGVDAAYTGTLRWISSDPAFTPYYALNQEQRSRLVYLAEIEMPPEAADLPPEVLDKRNSHSRGRNHRLLPEPRPWEGPPIAAPRSTRLPVPPQESTWMGR